MLSHREYQYWLTRRCKFDACWIIMARLGEMLNHPRTVYYARQQKADHHFDLDPHDLQYIYLTQVSPDGNRIISLVRDSRKYYLLDSTRKVKPQDPNSSPDAKEEEEEEEEEYDYHLTVHYHSDLRQLVQCLSGSMRKLIGAVLPQKAKLKAGEKSALKGVTYIDFINKGHQEQVSLMKKYLMTTKGEVLSLAGFLNLQPQVLLDAGSSQTYAFKQVTLSQNNLFTSFSWLKIFPHIHTLTIWSTNAITDHNLAELQVYGKGIQVLELHTCPRVSGRSLLTVAKLPSVVRCIIDYVGTEVHEGENYHETIITDEEWQDVSNNTLQFLLMNSYRMTMDFVQMVLDHFCSLEHLVINDAVLEHLRKNTMNGYSDRQVTFHSAKNLHQGFKRYRDIKIANLARDRLGHTFSESMLAKIAEKDKGKKEIIKDLKS